MSSNLDRYKNDLQSLITRGDQLFAAIYAECFPREYEKQLKELLGSNARDSVKPLPQFTDTYQIWYSEAKMLVKQLLPDRLEDFADHYERPKSRKSITNESYRIEDYLQGLSVNSGTAFEKTKIVGPEAAIPHVRQQVAILKSVQARFESSLFDIRQLAQADLFDSELAAADELAKNKFARAAGALAGVVLERHLGQVCNNHSIKVAKKAPVISDLNNALKDTSVIDLPQWRFIQHLADIRNLCDHDKQTEPTAEQVNDLVAGVAKVSKTLF